MAIQAPNGALPGAPFALWVNGWPHAPKKEKKGSAVAPWRQIGPCSGRRVSPPPHSAAPQEARSPWIEHTAFEAQQNRSRFVGPVVLVEVFQEMRDLMLQHHMPLRSPLGLPHTPQLSINPERESCT